MTGTNERSSSWLPSAILPVLVTTVEASWISLWVSSIANSGHPHRFDIPYLAVALPAAASVVLSTFLSRRPWSTWLRHVALFVAWLLVTMVAAGSLGALYLHGSFVADGAHPWTVTANLAGDGAGLACFLGALAAARGSWLGQRELSLNHATNSMAISTGAYVILFAFAAISHDASFRAEVTPAAVLLFVLFPGAVGALALVHEREFELDALHTRVARPSLAWLGAIALPMAVVAVAVLLVALLFGPAAPLLDRAVHDVGSGIGRVIAAIANWITDLLHHVHLTKHHVGEQQAGGVPKAVHLKATKPAWWARLIAEAGVAAILIAILRFWVPMLLQLRYRKRRHRQLHGEVTEERESVFTWRHLLDQLSGWFRGLFRRHTPAIEEATTQAERLVEEPHGSSVRFYYLQLLRGARHVGLGRGAAETPTELARRILVVSDASNELSLRSITASYERARYGADPGDDQRVDEARRNAEVLITTWQERVTQE